MAVRQLLRALRVATSVPASKVGSLADHPSSARPAQAASQAGRSTFEAASRSSQASRRDRPLAPAER